MASFEGSCVALCEAGHPDCYGRHWNFTSSCPDYGTRGLYRRLGIPRLAEVFDEGGSPHPEGAGKVYHTLFWSLY